MIAKDTLVIVQHGDLVAAEARITDLETAWDEAAPALVPKDKQSWKALDRDIDAALAALRKSSPDAKTCSAMLKALLADFDKYGMAA